MGLRFNANDDQIKKFLKLTSSEKHENAKIDRYFEEYAREYGLTKEELLEAFNVSIWAPTAGGDQMGFNTGDSSSPGNSSIETMLSDARQKRVVMGISTANRQRMGELTRDDAVNPNPGTGNATPQQQAIDLSFQQGIQEAQSNVERTRANGQQSVATAQSGVTAAQNTADANNRAAKFEESKAATGLNEAQIKGDKQISYANASAVVENEQATGAQILAEETLAAEQQSSTTAIANANSKSSQNNTQAQNDLNTARTTLQTAQALVTNLENSISDMEKNLKTMHDALENNPDANENDVADYNKALKEKDSEEEKLEKAKKDAEAAQLAVKNAEQNVTTVEAQGKADVAAAESKGAAAVSAAQASADKAAVDAQTTRIKNDTNIAAVTATVNNDIATRQADVASKKQAGAQVEAEGVRSVDNANNELKKAEAAAAQNNNAAEQQLQQLKEDRAAAISKASNGTAAVDDIASSQTDNNIAKRIQNNPLIGNPNEEEQDESLLMQDLEYNKRHSSATFNPLGNNPKVKIEKTAQQLFERKNDDLAVKEPDEHPAKNNRRTFGI